MAPVRNIAALLKHLSKGGKGTARKPLLGKGALDRALTNQADFDSLMRTHGGLRRGSAVGEILPHRDVVGKSYFKGGRANRNIPPEYYGRGGTQTTDAAQHGGPDQWAADRRGPRWWKHPIDEPSGLRATYEPSVGRFPTPAERRAGARGPSGRERREERTRMAKGMGVRRKEKYHPLLMESDPDFVQQVLAGDPDALARYLGRPPIRRG